MDRQHLGGRYAVSATTSHHDWARTQVRTYAKAQMKN